MTIITHANLPTTRTYISKSRQHRFVNAATGAKSSTIVEELIPPGGFISDWQDDMVAAARDRLDGRHPGFAFAKLDANAITRADGCFDTVLSFHLGMSPGDRCAEMQRVLRPGGLFYMSTVGEAYLCEMAELVHRFDPRADFWGLFPREPFYLENGAEQLAPFYAEIQSHRYANKLAIDQPEPIVDFVRTTNGRSIL
jgi:SAM-dependent methyltransferase